MYLTGIIFVQFFSDPLLCYTVHFPVITKYFCNPFGPVCLLVLCVLATFIQKLKTRWRFPVCPCDPVCVCVCVPHRHKNFNLSYLHE